MRPVPPPPPPPKATVADPATRSDRFDGPATPGSVQPPPLIVPPHPPFLPPPPSVGPPPPPRPLAHAAPPPTASPTRAPGAYSTPVLAPAARYGLAGQLIDLIEPDTEADPTAVLVQLLTAFGIWVGPGPHVVIGPERHPARLFAAIVGRSATARKGTSFSHVSRLLRLADPGFLTACTSTGLSTGEGLIEAVRDGEGEDDPGVTDKRLLVTEEEFAAVFARSSRTGSVLSQTIRRAWDTGDLRVMTRSPYRATGAHIGIVGHITRDELHRVMCDTEQTNGFGNRFLWVYVARRGSVPLGGDLTDADLRPYADRLRAAADAARNVAAVGLTPPATARWIDVYEDLAGDRPGVLGSLTARGAPIVRRLALVYALLDGAAEPVVDRPHLDAALAVWDYAAQSVRAIFGDATGDRTADAILKALRAGGPAGLTRTDIRDRLGRHTPEADIEYALETLARCGLARGGKEPATKGRPAERWHATGPGM